MIKFQKDLIGAWNLRSALSDPEALSPPERQRIAAMFLETTLPSDSVGTSGKSSSNLPDRSLELAQLGIEAGLSTSVFCAELRNCQVCLCSLFVANSVEASARQTPVERDGAMQCISDLLISLDELIVQSATRLSEGGDSAGPTTTSPDNHVKKRKTLQHEIRTPLQGALLTTELMLEDAGHGDPVSADDVMAVRKSIETAVGILNDFASRANPE